MTDPTPTLPQETPTDSDLLLVERTAYSYGNKPVEWRRGFYCTNRHHYRNDLG